MIKLSVAQFKSFGGDDIRYLRDSLYYHKYTNMYANNRNCNCLVIRELTNEYIVAPVKQLIREYGTRVRPKVMI